MSATLAGIRLWYHRDSTPTPMSIVFYIWLGDASRVSTGCFDLLSNGWGQLAVHIMSFLSTGDFQQRLKYAGRPSGHPHVLEDEGWMARFPFLGLLGLFPL